MSAARYPWTAAVLSALLGEVALGTTPLSASRLQESCAAYTESRSTHPGRVCASYVQGFLDSARSGTKLVARPPTGPRLPQTWEERAARTRLGKGYLEALRERHYCVPDSVVVSQIVEQLVEYLRANPPKPQMLAVEALSRTLGLHYPCK